MKGLPITKTITKKKSLLVQLEWTYSNQDGMELS